LALIVLGRLSVVLPYTFIAIDRLAIGGVDLFVGDTIVDVVRANGLRDSVSGINWFRELDQDSGWAVLLKTGFVGMTCVEAASLVALRPGVLRRVWMWAVLISHAGVGLSMNIWFWENALMILVLFGRCSYDEPKGPSRFLYKGKRSTRSVVNEDPCGLNGVARSYEILALRETGSRRHRGPQNTVNDRINE